MNVASHKQCGMLTLFDLPNCSRRRRGGIGLRCHGSPQNVEQCEDDDQSKCDHVPVRCDLLDHQRTASAWVSQFAHDNAEDDEAHEDLEEMDAGELVVETEELVGPAP